MQKLPQISQICTDADCVILPQNSQIYTDTACVILPQNSQNTQNLLTKSICVNL